MQVRIEKLVSGGAGMARTDRGVVFIEDAAPGDLLQVELTGRRRGVEWGRIESVLEPGPGRRIPPCPLTATCGGCDWQHLTYPTQLAAKADVVRESFRRIARIELPEATRLHPSPEWAYRRRARFHVQKSAGVTRVGFLGRRSHRVVAIDRCPILATGLQSALERLTRSEAVPVGEVTALIGSDAGVAYSRSDGGAAETVSIEVAGERLTASPGAFFQANGPLLEDLVVRVLQLAGGGTTCLDLFAGVGLFTLPLSRRFDRVVAAEQSQSARALLIANAASRPGIVVEPGTAEQVLARLERGPTASAAILDPPRTGLSPRARQLLIARPPDRIVYVGCDPVALARDVRNLVEEAGYAVSSVDLFDLFPQTHHLEAVAHLISQRLL